MTRVLFLLQSEKLGVHGAVYFGLLPNIPTEYHPFGN